MNNFWKPIKSEVLAMALFYPVSLAGAMGVGVNLSQGNYADVAKDAAVMLLGPSLIYGSTRCLEKVVESKRKILWNEIQNQKIFA